MAILELARDEDLGVFSLSAVQWCQSTSAFARPRSGAFDILGFGLQPLASAVKLPRFVSQAAAAASSWL